MSSLLIGASGGIGRALLQQLAARGPAIGLSRSAGDLDLLDQASIAAAAERVAPAGPFDSILVATGLLHGPGLSPERSWKELTAERLLHSLAVNAVGPALCLRHFLPMLAPTGRFAALSAWVGSISDNRLGGWYAYRASKAALNQLVRTAAIELARTRPYAVCVTLHPGTVNTAMSRPFGRSTVGRQLFEPAQAARQLLAVLNGLSPADSGLCFDWAGKRISF